MQQNGFFEAALQLAHPEKKIELRSLAWTGDELGYRLRPERYVNHLKKLLDRWSADHVILGFGLYESFAGLSGIEKFKADLNGYLDEIRFSDVCRYPDGTTFTTFGQDGGTMANPTPFTVDSDTLLLISS